MSRSVTSRRNFLRTTATVAAATPLLQMLNMRRVDAAPLRRVMFVYIPDGCIPSRFHPTGTEKNFTLADMTSPLESVKQHCVFIDGLSMFGGGATHEGGIRKVLTGTADVSLDIFLGQKFAGQTPHNALQLGVAANFQNGSGGMSFIGREQEVKPDDDPLNAFSRVFGNVSTGGDDHDDRAAQLAARRKKSVLDAALSDLTRLKGKYGPAEREKLETHTEAIREVERRITSTVTPGGGGAACDIAGYDRRGFANSPTDYYPKTYEKEEHFETVGRLQMDLAALALSCNMTRVVSLMFSHPVSPTHIPGVAPAHHDASHFGDPFSALANDFVKCQQHFMRQVAYLIDKLATTPEGDGTFLLDHTLVMVCSELGDANAHDHRRVPFILAGKAGFALETGRFLNYQNSYTGPFASPEEERDKNQPHAKLLVSIANLMNVTIDSYGYVGRGRGGLEGLV